jgi:tRNA(Ile)-lysidine synthase
MFDIVRNRILKETLFRAGETTVLGVSGGADSLALLHILLRLRIDLGIQLQVVTIDHQLRGEAGAQDAAYVANLCQEWGVPCHVYTLDIRTSAALHKHSIEEEARRQRYQCLYDYAREIGATSIAVAHHADDQVETILLHLLRGTGTQGLQGMRAQAPLPIPNTADVRLVRPMLDVTRAQIEAYCAAHQLQPRHDASNDDTLYQRNRIRHDLIPYLQNFAPHLRDHLLRLAEISQLENQYIHAQLEQTLLRHTVTQNERVQIELVHLQQTDEALQRRFILWALAALGGEQDHARVLAAVALIRKARLGAVCQFGGGVQARIDYQTLVFEQTPIHEHAQKQQSAQTQYVLLPPELPIMTLSAETQVALVNGMLHVSATAHDGWDAIMLPLDAQLVLRGRQDGDRVAWQGMDGKHQKLNEWMVNNKIPRAVRDRLPLLVCDDRIMGVWWRGAWRWSVYFVTPTNAHRVVYVHISAKN